MANSSVRGFSWYTAVDMAEPPREKRHKGGGARRSAAPRRTDGAGGGSAGLDLVPLAVDPHGPRSGRVLAQGLGHDRVVGALRLPPQGDLLVADFARAAGQRPAMPVGLGHGPADPVLLGKVVEDLVRARC